jgi:integrase
MLLSDFALDFLTFSSQRLKPSTLRDYRYCLDTHILPRLGSKHLHTITTRDVLSLQSAMASTPARANRAVNIVLRMVRVASQLGYKVRQLERPRLFTERKRQRYLDREEAARLLGVLDREPSLASVIIRLLLLTGCRKSELLSLRWDAVDCERSVLRLEDSKTGARVVPLSSEALTLIASLPRCGGQFVFAGRNGHVATFQRAWERIRRVAGLEDLRLHDLRHSWASFAVSAGISLPVVGAVLGHRHPATTLRYAHVHPEAALAATAAVSKQLLAEIA